jgi:hypothetical protein
MKELLTLRDDIHSIRMKLIDLQYGVEHENISVLLEHAGKLVEEARKTISSLISISELHDIMTGKKTMVETK